MPLTFRERQQQAREQAILDAAFELLTTRGYAATTMDDVAAAVGISKATLYQHFKSKEELVVSVAIGVLRRMEAYLAGLDPALAAVERLRRVMRWIIELRYTTELRAVQGSTAGLVPVLKTVITHHPRFNDQKERLIRAFCALVEAAQAEGSLRTGIPTRVIVQAMLSLMRDFDYVELLASARLSPDALSDYLTSIFLDGVRAP